MVPTIELGGITIQRIVEQEGPFFDALQFFPKLTTELLAEVRPWLQPRYMTRDDKLNLCIQSYIVRTAHHNILIDTCVGNHKPRPTRPFWHMMKSGQYEKNLAASGLTVNDFVMCTHLHTDHVGWNTRLDNGSWVPTFPKAKYVFADRELAYWTTRQKEDPDSCPWVTDSVLPIVGAKREMIVKSEGSLNDLVHLIPTPGHTIDHYSVHVGTPGKDAIITGDMVHSPLQMRYPEIGMLSDYDSAIAGQSRRKLFGQFCDTSTLLCTAHFPTPCTGHITRWKDSFDFVSTQD